MNVKTKRLHPSALLPDRAHASDAGADLFSLEDVEIPPQSAVKARTGLAIALPEGTAGIVWGKSSLESQGLIVTAGLVDEGYRGEVLVCLFNLTKEIKTLAKGQKMAQLLVMPVHYAAFEEVDELEASHRGGGGFGSTGKLSSRLKAARPRQITGGSAKAVWRKTTRRVRLWRKG